MSVNMQFDKVLVIWQGFFQGCTPDILAFMNVQGVGLFLNCVPQEKEIHHKNTKCLFQNFPLSIRCTVVEWGYLIFGLLLDWSVCVCDGRLLICWALVIMHHRDLFFFWGEASLTRIVFYFVAECPYGIIVPFVFQHHNFKYFLLNYIIVAIAILINLLQLFHCRVAHTLVNDCVSNSWAVLSSTISISPLFWVLIPVHVFVGIALVSLLCWMINLLVCLVGASSAWFECRCSCWVGSIVFFLFLLFIFLSSSPCFL